MDLKLIFLLNIRLCVCVCVGGGGGVVTTHTQYKKNIDIAYIL